MEQQPPVQHCEVRLWYSTFSYFIAYWTWLPSCVAFTALYLLARLKAWFPAIVCYDTCSNKPWHVVGQGMFSLKKI
ncbi:hypothetical protein BKA62DRAFT_708024 [Auriculariales sp. MPI-PUGE-AT-0066]|nr:hypothetical protein BKA62DRAFT_708024 [Auriculariales sp. MPI-PUGE-AT-0066]